MMTRVMLLAALVLGAMSFTGCQICEPNQEVPISWSASDGLNPYDGAKHKLYVYFFYVSSPTQFMNIPVEQLTAPGASNLAAMKAGETVISPGASNVFRMGPRGQDSYEWVGVLATYYQNAQRKVEKIPDDCSLKIQFEDRAIGTFTSK